MAPRPTAATQGKALSEAQQVRGQFTQTPSSKKSNAGSQDRKEENDPA